ncbi:hypothetical protein Zmor_015269 [Zophobas morio]|uniref:Ricin B lectin domain-containing protein n=1 Tax=Zophobas morio TaxID=2755281 RepID=A0AA38IDW0_9CUCU|nr:hypothetical protein Zmor_015269 [Zophobas morio]
MVYFSQLLLWFMVFVLFPAVPAIECNTAQIYAFRAPGINYFAIDCSDPNHVRIQHYNANLAAQRWTIQCGSTTNLFYLVNVINGYVLNVNRTAPHYAIVSEKDGSLWQQWEIPSDTFVNEAIRSSLAINGSSSTAGPALFLSTAAQIWEFIKL